MKKKIMLTSVLAIGFAYPAIAETFPSDGVMLENATYENAATYSNMGVYDGTVTATAEYENVLYDVPAGTYLPAASEVVTPCPAGNYCVGMADLLYSETESQGLAVCPTTHPNSADGASVDTQCYTACTLEGANIPHATAVDGNDYFGTGADTCGATACENGYHVNDEISIVEKNPVVDADWRVSVTDVAYITDKNSSYGWSENASVYGLTEGHTWAVKTDGGIVYGRAGFSAGATGLEQYFENNYFAVINGDLPVSEFMLGLEDLTGTNKAKFIVDLILDVKNNNKTEEELLRAMYIMFLSDSNTIQYDDSKSIYGNCYCQITGFVPNGGTLQAIQSAPWVRNSGVGYPGNQEAGCANNCARSMQGDGFAYSYAYRAAIYGAFEQMTNTTCEANTINITWSDADQADIDANNAGACEYDGDIRTPVKAIKKPGKTFKGWKFQK